MGISLAGRVPADDEVLGDVLVVGLRHGRHRDETGGRQRLARLAVAHPSEVGNGDRGRAARHDEREGGAFLEVRAGLGVLADDLARDSGVVVLILAIDLPAELAHLGERGVGSRADDTGYLVLRHRRLRRGVDGCTAGEQQDHCGDRQQQPSAPALARLLLSGDERRATRRDRRRRAVDVERTGAPI